MSRPWTVTAVLLGTLLTAGALAAQDRTYGTDGNGTLHTGDDRARQEIQRVEATVYQNGGIDLRLMKGRDEWMFRGSWYGSPGSGSVGFRLDSGFELPADGWGRLYLGGGALSRVDFRGTNRDGAFELSFVDRSGDGGGLPGDNAGMDIMREGDGDLDIGDRSDRLDRARVRLDDDGRAELRLWGDERYAMTGSWSGSIASGRVRVAVNRWGRDRADISGTINTSRRSGWDRLAFDGNVDDREVRLRFNGDGPALDPERGDDESEGEPRRPINSLDQTMRGAGELKLEGEKGTDLRAARLNLRRGGKVEIYLEGGAPRMLLRGKWSQRDNAPAIDLTITDGLGQGTGGLGTVTIPDGNNWERLNLSGRNGSGSWTIRFRANGPGHLTPDSTTDRPEPVPIRELTETVKGEGSLSWPGEPRPTTITQIRVVLTADKKATVEVEGSKPARFTGSWATTRQPDQLVLAITGGTMEAMAAGGTITLTDKRTIATLTLGSRVVRRPMQLRFKAQTAAAVVPPR